MLQNLYSLFCIKNNLSTFYRNIIFVVFCRFKFNILCSFGLLTCGTEVALLAWGSILFGNLLAMLVLAYLLRYSEGANYFIVIMVNSISFHI